MKNKRYLDKKKRKVYYNQELKLLIYKILLLQLKNNYKNNSLVYSIKYLIDSLNNQGCKTKIKNRCVITGRTHAVDNKTKVSRIIFKKLVDNNQFSGYFKDSW